MAFKLITKEQLHYDYHHRYQSFEKENLDLLPYAFNGSQFNSKTFITKTLLNDNDAFTSNYPQPEFYYSHLEAKQMLVSHVTLRSPLRPSQKGYPLGAGLIFVANHFSDLQRTSEFDLMTKQQYLDWKNARQLPLYPWEPGNFPSPLISFTSWLLRDGGREGGNHRRARLHHPRQVHPRQTHQPPHQAHRLLQ